MKFIDMRKYDDFPKPLRNNKYKFIICMLIISVISWAVFYVYLNLSSILMAFKQFVGYVNGEEIYVWSLGNFTKFWDELTTKSYIASSFKEALKNTLFLYVFGNLVTIPSSFIISYYLYKKIAAHKVFRTIFYLPSILSTVVMVIIFQNIVAPHGLLSSISVSFGGEAITDLLTTDKYAKWSVLIYCCWIGFPGVYILLTSAMNRIPNEIIECGKIEGVGSFKEFFSIIVPMIWPTLYIIIIQKIAGVLTADGPILLLTQGRYNTTTIGYWFYSQVILSHSYEYPSAIGLIMTIVIAPIAIISRKLLDNVYQDVEY